MFKPVESKVNFPRLEERILKLWKEESIFERSVAARRGGPLFVLYEGPPTANGSPGIHHVLARVFKDVIPRYKVMKGYYAPRQAGWDTHGLPVELEVEQKLGFTSKADIEKYGIAEFNRQCRDSVFSYLKDWEAMTERIAYWVDMSQAYITMDNKYIETVWWALKQMWDKGLIYQGYRVTPHCPRCGTSLSSHEVAQGYRDDTEDPSVYIKFKVAKELYESPGFLEQLRKVYGDETANFAQKLLYLTKGRDIYLLAWTTTPWTLPGNTALAVSRESEYVIVEDDSGYLVLAYKRLEAVGLANRHIIDKVNGRALVDLIYEPLYNPRDFGVPLAMTDIKEKDGRPSANILRKKGGILNYPVIGGDFVSMEDGTGIVHIAPAYGEVDYQAGEENGLDFVHPVDLQGMMMGKYPFSGLFVKEADPLVLQDLKSRGLLYKSETIRHTYPFCWRCGTPLLYYAKQTWYIRTTAVKDALIAGNKEINWYPEHIKYGRFGDWLENNVDWAFSRERYWGTPLPVWQCESCGRYECIGGLDELKGKPGLAGLREPMDLHRPFVDDVTFRCSSCGGKMRRMTEVIDCWFDSGAMPVAQWHYPFENGTLLEDGRFPADYICEAVDQTRGWFYSLHAISTLLFNRICYRNVICLGHILDIKGEKMSKSRGNMVLPWVVINKYGADALRWYCLTATSPGNVRRFSEDMVAEITRRFLLTLWNVYSFFVLYANIDRYNPAAKPDKVSLSELDRWITSELSQLVADVDKSLDGYDPTEAGRKLEVFVDALSNWYVRRSRRRFWKSENDADKLAAYSTLYQCLVTLAKLLAPFMPFVAEEIYQNLVHSVLPEAPVSVHLADFPPADMAKVDQQLSDDIRMAMKVSSLGRAARSEAGIKVRQPLAEVMVYAKSGRERESLQRVSSQILEELNVKSVEVVAEASLLEKPGYRVSSEGDLMVAIPTEISPELQAEGMAREIVHRLQTMRRSAGFEIADYITTCYQGDEYIAAVMTGFDDYIKQETLSRHLVVGVPEQGVYTEKFKLSGHEFMLGVRKEAI
jgi:isoleucyl-tRNA synthetase